MFVAYSVHFTATVAINFHGENRWNKMRFYLGNFQYMSSPYDDEDSLLSCWSIVPLQISFSVCSCFSSFILRFSLDCWANFEQQSKEYVTLLLCLGKKEFVFHMKASYTKSFIKHSLIKCSAELPRSEMKVTKEGTYLKKCKRGK